MSRIMIFVYEGCDFATEDIVNAQFYMCLG